MQFQRILPLAAAFVPLLLPLPVQAQPPEQVAQQIQLYEAARDGTSSSCGFTVTVSTADKYGLNFNLYHMRISGQPLVVATMAQLMMRLPSNEIVEVKPEWVGFTSGRFSSDRIPVFEGRAGTKTLARAGASPAGTGPAAEPVLRSMQAGGVLEFRLPRQNPGRSFQIKPAAPEVLMGYAACMKRLLARMAAEPDGGGQEILAPGARKP
jgi:hypothetical protein